MHRLSDRFGLLPGGAPLALWQLLAPLQEARLERRTLLRLSLTLLSLSLTLLTLSLALALIPQP